MAKNGYRKISSDGEEKRAGFVSFLLFHWMNGVFKTGSERPLEVNDLLPLPEENVTSSLIDRLQANWDKEKATSKEKGNEPKLWKSVMKMFSLKETMILISISALYSFSRIIQPLFLGYLISTLMSPEPQKSYLLYLCAAAMGVNALIGCLSMHHFDYRCELLGIRLSSALKGLVYLKVSKKKKKNH